MFRMKLIHHLTLISKGIGSELHKEKEKIKANKRFTNIQKAQSQASS